MTTDSTLTIGQFLTIETWLDDARDHSWCSNVLQLLAQDGQFLVVRNLSAWWLDNICLNLEQVSVHPLSDAYVVARLGTHDDDVPMPSWHMDSFRKDTP